MGGKRKKASRRKGFTGNVLKRRENQIPDEERVFCAQYGGADKGGDRHQGRSPVGGGKNQLPKK